MRPAVTVIIPVKDDAVRLGHCLDALASQTFTGGIEVLVVDNGSSDNPGAVVSQHDSARLLFESRPSSYAARNLGARAAVGDVLAFTDADCLPAPDWIERAYAYLLASGEPSFVAGHVDVFVGDPANPTLVERYELLHAFRQDINVELFQFGVTANLLVRKTVFERVGPFDAELVSSGDREWGQRAHSLECRGHYAADARVRHPARRSWAELRRKQQRIQYGDVQLRHSRGQAAVDWEILRLIVRPPLRKIRRNLPNVAPPTLAARATYVSTAVFAHYLALYERLRLVVRRGRDA